MDDVICNRDKEDNVLPIWFDGIDSCLDFLKKKGGGKFLYFFRIDENLFKVGMSNKIIQRLTTHQKKLGDRIGVVGIIGNVTLYKQIESVFHFSMYHAKRTDGERLFESGILAYDSETYKIPENISDFKEMIETILKLLKSVYQSNLCEWLGEDESFGFDLFNPQKSDKGLGAFLLKFIDL
jgi:hypothetical protein